jgi:hypothetical protein
MGGLVWDLTITMENNVNTLLTGSRFGRDALHGLRQISGSKLRQAAALVRHREQQIKPNRRKSSVELLESIRSSYRSLKPTSAFLYVIF